MNYRDANGHFCSRETAIAQGTFTPPANEAAAPATEEATRPENWGAGAAPIAPGQRTAYIETGRGHSAEVLIGAPFTETVERIAAEAHYGGYFRVFVNGEEVLEPSEAPDTITGDQRISITPYDKVGV